jgi:hypothetical protein
MRNILVFFLASIWSLLRYVCDFFIIFGLRWPCSIHKKATMQQSYFEDLFQIYHYLSGRENAPNLEKDVVPTRQLKITRSRKTKSRN